MCGGYRGIGYSQSAYFIEQLKNIPQIKEVRGRGLMIGIDMGKPIKPLREKLLYRDKIFTSSLHVPNAVQAGSLCYVQLQK